MSQTYQDTLAVGACVENYEVVRPLGSGSFGITYLAVDQDLNANVAIKEYMPRNFAVRAEKSSDLVLRNEAQKADYEFGLEGFLAEAQTLARFRDPHFVSVKRYFKANNTAYIVMDYEQGQSLRDYLLANPDPPSEVFLLSIVIPILMGLRKLHKEGFLHRDIKPGNIYLRENNVPVLIDFGAARQAFGEVSHSLTEIVTPNYSPFEQYVNEGEQGPTTDLYAIGATLYKCIAEVAPVDAIKRIASLNEGKPDPLVPAVKRGRGRYSEAFLMTVDWMLQPYARDRPQSAQVAIDDLAVATITEFGGQTDTSLLSKILSPQSDPEDRVWMLAHRGSEQTMVRKTSNSRPISSNTVADKSRASLFPERFALVFLSVLMTLALVVFAITNIDKPSGHRDSSQLIDPWLRKARQALAEERFLHPRENNALEYFKAVLEIDSSNQGAIDGIDRLLKHYVKQTNEAVAQDSIVKANEHLAQLGDVLSTIRRWPYAFEFLPAAEQETRRLKKRIDQNVEKRKSEVVRRREQLEVKRQQLDIAQLLNQAQIDFEADRLSFPPKQNAYDRFQKVLDLDPKNPQAIDGLKRIVDRYIVLVQAMASQRNYEKAEEYLENAKRVLPDSAKLRTVYDALLHEKTAFERSKKLKFARRRSTADAGNNNPTAYEPEKLARIPRLLEVAKQHMAALRLESPQGSNAVETYQQILALDRENADARRAIDRIRKQTGWLRITGLPSDGDLFVDDIKLAHQGHLTIKLFSGFHTVTVKTGSKPIESQLIRIRNGTESQIAFVEVMPPTRRNTPKPAEIPERFRSLPSAPMLLN